MSLDTTPTPGQRPRPRPPRIHIKNLHPNSGSMMGSYPPSAQIPFTAQTLGPGTTGLAAGAGQPYWPPYANPFAAGNFMAKGFEGFVDFTKSGLSFGEKFTFGLYNRMSKWSKRWFTHMFLLTIMTLYTVGGAYLFKKIEEREVQRVRLNNDFLEEVFLKNITSVIRDEDIRKYNDRDFKGIIRNILINYKPSVESILANGNAKDEKEGWTFMNAMFYCSTVYTTIGYGHITPKTVMGQALTMVYAIIGIPMFLILLADFGKLFTRCMKFFWAYVRRLYFTGTCRRIRKQQQVQNAIGGFNTMYDMAIRRPSEFFGMTNGNDVESQTTEAEKQTNASNPDTPTTPYPETFEIDDEFNLPVSLASILLISYVLVGAFIFRMKQSDWTYFEAIYFVFISMSTIGFGDLVPENAVFMMCTTIYLIFGLALTSMFINVVQEKLSDTFKQASFKIGTTIGLASEMGEDNNSKDIPPSELASIHGSRLDKIVEDDVERESHLNSILRPQKPVDSQNGHHLETSPPPLLPRRQVSIEEQPKPDKKSKSVWRF